MRIGKARYETAVEFLEGHDPRHDRPVIAVEPMSDAIRCHHLVDRIGPLLVPHLLEPAIEQRPIVSHVFLRGCVRPAGKVTASSVMTSR
jgi:hypothetical protein